MGAWSVKFNGVDKTNLVSLSREVNVTRTLNERTTATFSCLPGFAPARWTPVVEYDGITPTFGGLVLTRGDVQTFEQGKSLVYVPVTLADYTFYFDGSFITLNYTTDQTLKQVLIDAIALLPSSYGITLDASQATGPTITAPFGWTNTKVSDLFRSLSSQTGYVAAISFDLKYKMFVAGSVSAPFAITDSNPHAMKITWKDSTTFIPATDVILSCGRTGNFSVDQQWTADGVTTTWQVDIQALVGGATVGYVLENSTIRTLSGPGGGGYYEWNDTVGRGTLSLGIGSTPGAGVTLTLTYTDVEPFIVTASSGATPVVQYLDSFPDILKVPQGQAQANGILAIVDQSPREVSVVTVEGVGVDVGQLLPINLTDLMLVGDFLITAITSRRDGDGIWTYTITATEGTNYQGSALSQWRRLTGGSSSGSVTSGGGGGSSTTLSAPVYMGGSRNSAPVTQTPAAWTQIANWSVYIPSTALSVRLRVSIRSRNTGVTVTARLIDNLGNVIATTSAVTGPTSTIITAIGSAVAGRTYHVETLSGTDAEDVYCDFAQIEAA